MEGNQTKNLTILLIVMLFIIPSSVNVISTEETNMIFVDDDNIDGPWDGSYEHPFQFIQDGIDTANDGDTVFVYNGNYNEHLYINNTIYLNGQSRQTTIIEGGGEYGVIYVNDDDCIISGFTIKNSGKNPYYGGVMTNKDHIVITDNIFQNNRFSSIYLHQSEKSIIENNIFSDNGIGITFEYTTNTTVANNNITDGNCGIFLYESINNSFIGNNLRKNGFDLRNSYNNEFEGNHVNDRPFIYLRNTEDKIIDEAGQVILYQCENITMQNLNVSAATIGIKLDKSDYCTIRLSIINDNFYGIICRYADYNHIESNQIDYNLENGLYLYKSILNYILNNSIEYNHLDSINLEYSWGNIVRNNSIKSQYQSTGIHIYYSSYNELIDNEIQYSQYAGIDLSNNCSFTDIIGNNIANNQYQGIEIGGGYNNSIIDNTIKKNEFAIQMSGKNFCFINNTVITNKWGIRCTDTPKCNISYNMISNTSRDAIFVDDSEDVTIKRNIIHDNWGTIFLIRSDKVIVTENNIVDSQVNIHFVKPNMLHNQSTQISWDGNYWDYWPFNMPKPILGMKIFPLLIPIIRLPIPLPAIDFDENPSPEPFDCNWNKTMYLKLCKMNNDCWFYFSSYKDDYDIFQDNSPEKNEYLTKTYENKIDITYHYKGSN